MKVKRKSPPTFTVEHRRKMSESRKGKKRPKEVGIKISLAKKGHLVSKETRVKISQSNKGHIPWNKGMKGSLKHTEKTKDIIRMHSKGRKLSEETKIKISLLHTGKKKTKEHRAKLSASKINSEKTPRGEKCNFWKGGISKNTEHYRVARIMMLAKCEGSHSKLEWEDLKKFYNYMCLCCKRFEPEIKLTKDHIIPVSKNGSDFIENIQPLCRTCNSRKCTKTIKYEI